MKLSFTKMHGAGNDFAVVDARQTGFDEQLIDQSRRAALANRNTGIGFDQLLVIEAPRGDSDAWIRIFNADGAEAQQCGNGLRCVAQLMTTLQPEQTTWELDGLGGLVNARVKTDNTVSVQMTVPEFGAQATGCKVDSPVQIGAQSIGFETVSMGNPHAVVEVPLAAAAAVTTIGKAMQSHFVDGVNVGFAQQNGPDSLILRVYERGVGETLACGTGACAAAVTLLRKRGSGGQVSVSLPGGVLVVRWSPGEPVWLSGPAQKVYDGSIEV